MGDHRTNPRAIAAAARPGFQAGDEHYKGSTETVIELNAGAMAIADAAVQGARAAGGDERQAFAHACADWDPKVTPERFDVVVYDRMMIMRPNPFLPDPNMVPTAMIRMGERSRTPLSDLRARADQAFEQAKGSGPNPQ